MCFMVEMIAIHLLGQILKYILLLIWHLGLFSGVPGGQIFSECDFSFLHGSIALFITNI